MVSVIIKSTILNNQYYRSQMWLSKIDYLQLCPCEKIKTIKNRKCSVNCKKSLIWIYSFFKLTVLFCYLILVKIYIFYFCEFWYLYPLKWLTDAEIINRKWQLSDLRCFTWSCLILQLYQNVLFGFLNLHREFTCQKYSHFP